MVIGILPRVVRDTVTASGALPSGSHTPVNASSASATMTLPSGVNAGMVVSVSKEDATANTVTVSGTISGGPVVLSTQYETVELTAETGGTSWRVTSRSITPAALSATYVPVGRNTVAPSTATSPIAQGAAADYSGSNGVTGTGTDNRAAIQAALDAASSVSLTTSYYSYATRRAVTVKLPAGHYLISAPSDGSPSLNVPLGVTFDFSEANLYFDYPATATDHWAAIQVNNLASLKVGKLIQSGRVAVPDSRDMYDGIRLLATDFGTTIVGVNGEINGFQGAAIRSIGAWEVHIKGTLVAQSGSYGFITSKVGTAYGYTLPANAPANPRYPTDSWMDGFSWVNMSKGGMLGPVTGDTGTPNALYFGQYGGIVSYRNADAENIGGEVFNLTSLATLTVDAVDIECAGKHLGPIFRLNNVRSVSISNIPANYDTRPIARQDGTTGTVAPAYFIFGQVHVLRVQNVFMNNTLGAMTLVGSDPFDGWHISGIYSENFGFTTDTYFKGNGATSIGGGWNVGHLTVGSNHLWVDSTGALRRKASAPTSDTDGAALADSVSIGRLQHAALGVTLGDSITAGANPTTALDSASSNGGSWPSYSAILSGQAFRIIANAGVGGNRTSDMVARFATDVAARAPKFVIINGGRNDISGSIPAATFQANIAALVAATRAAGARPILSTIAPTNQGAPYQQTTANWNKWLRAYAAANQIDLLDFYAALADPQTGQYKAGLNSDTVHPNQLGYYTLAKYVAARLPTILGGVQPPAVPIDAADTDNKLFNGFWTTQTLTTGAPSGWTQSGGSGLTSSAFSVDGDGVVWLNYTANALAGTFTTNPFTGNQPIASADETWVLSGRVKTALTAGSVRVLAVCRATGTTTYYPMFDLPYDITDGRFYMELPAQSGTAIKFQIFIAAGTTGTVSFAQLSLTRLADFYA